MGYLSLEKEFRVYFIIIFYFAILFLFVWTLRGIILYPLIRIVISIYNFFATDSIPSQPPLDLNISLPVKPVSY